MSSRCLAGHAAARALRVAGVPFVSGVAGESFLPLLDGLRQEGLTFRSVVHESGATFLSSAHARMTGRAAVAAVTRGPGASNALIGIHEAAQAGAPVVLIVGQIETRVRGRKALQEMEMTQVFGSVAKAVFEVSRAEQIVPSVLAAIRKAELPRPGPVVVSIPSDLFFDEIPAADETLRPPRTMAAVLDAASVAELAEKVRRARRGLFVVGAAFGGGRHAQLLGRIAERTGFGVIGGHAFPDALPSTHPGWLGCSTIRGSRALKDALTQADVVVLLDHWLGDRVTQGYLPLGADITAVVATAEAGWDEYLDADILVASPVAALGQLEEALRSDPGEVAPRARWVEERRVALERERDQILKASREAASSGRVPFSSIVEALDASLPPDVTLVSDAGSFNDWVVRYLPFPEGRRYVGTLSGSMGFGVPGALGVQLSGATPRTLAFVGDGGFLMTGMESATIAHLELPVTIVVFRNDAWGSIAIHQDRHFPGRRFGTELPRVSYAALARALSMPGYRAETADELRSALREGLALTGPALIEVMTDPGSPSPASYEGGAIS